MKQTQNIKNLPVHLPEDWLWQNIESRLNAEDWEQQKLQQALLALPSYAPKDSLWKDVENTMQNADNESFKLKKALSILTKYEPPTQVWEVIVLELPAQKTSFLRVLRFDDVRLAAAAAMIGFLMTISLMWYANRPSVDSTSLSYSKEIIDNSILEKNNLANQEDERAFAMVEEICQTQTFICEQPNVKILKTQLDELNEAQLALKEAIGSFGSDESLLQQLGSVEQERTEVLKQIMELI